jgi:NADH-quinone oxidoreductase subunit N
MDTIASLKYIIPELLLTTLVVVVIVMDLLLRKGKELRAGYLTLWGSLFILAYLIFSPAEIHSLFEGTIVVDPFARFFKIVAMGAVVLTVWITFYTESLRHYFRSEFWILLLIGTLGIFLVVSSIDLLMIYISFELLSLMSYILTGYLLKDARSNEASLKYLIYGAFSSGLMLFGFTWLYGLTGTLRIDEIHSAFQNGLLDGNSLALVVSFILIIAGLGYKIAAVPFHFWSPDVYEGAPTPFTAFLSVAPKAAGFALLIRILNLVFSGEGALANEFWQMIPETNWTMFVAILSVASMTLGNFVALQQTGIKRLLAYSSIAHAGYMLMAVVVLSQAGISAVMYYFIVYLLMNFGAFFTAIAVENRSGDDKIASFAGLGYRAPLMGVMMTLFMFSLTGLPPTAGFIGKFYIFASVIQAGNQWYWLAVVGILNSVVSLWYYARVIITMYSTNQEYDSSPLLVERPLVFILIILAIPTLLLGVYWAPVYDFVLNSLHFFLPI